MTRNALVLMLTATTLASCSTDSAREPQRWVADGPTVNCITTSQIRSTHVVDDQTVQFMMTGNRMMQNTLPFACSGLGMQRAFQHNSRTAQLCSVNSITVINRGSGPAQGASCGLGPFQPMKQVKASPAG